MVLHEQKCTRKMHRRRSNCLCYKTRCIVQLSPAIVPYIFEVVNVLIYDYNMDINVLDCSTWNSNHSMHPMCEYIYAHVYMSMHSLHGCEVSLRAMLIIWTWCISCVVNYFVSWRRTACFAVANACSFIRIVLGSIQNELVYKCKYWVLINIW